MRRVWYLPDFWTDVQASREWYEEQRAGLGAEFAAAVTHAIAKVIENAEAYRVARERTRRVLLARFRHLIFFELDGDMLLILGVVHGSRETRRWLRERRRRR